MRKLLAVAVFLTLLAVTGCSNINPFSQQTTPDAEPLITSTDGVDIVTTEAVGMDEDTGEIDLISQEDLESEAQDVLSSTTAPDSETNTYGETQPYEMELEGDQSIETEEEGETPLTASTTEEEPPTVESPAPTPEEIVVSAVEEEPNIPEPVDVIEHDPLPQTGDSNMLTTFIMSLVFLCGAISYIRILRKIRTTR